MKLTIVTLLLGLFISLTSIADEQNHRINIQALNSPVKMNSSALFSLELPAGFIPGKVKYEINGPNQKKLEHSVQLENKDSKWIAKIPTTNLEPGSFKIEFEVKADRSWMDTIKDLIKGKSQKEAVHPNEGEHKGFAEISIVKGPILPPDPGEAGKATLEGTDSNNNGVRDDVEIWIYQNYGHSEKTTAALMQLARTTQLELLNAADKVKSIEASYQMFRAVHCLKYVVGREKGSVLSKLLDAQILNTDARIRADIKTNTNFSGQVITAKPNYEKSECDFDPATMSN